LLAHTKRLPAENAANIEKNVSWQNFLFARRLRLSLVVSAACLGFPLSVARAAPPDYKLGDVATEDVVTPVPLLVVNPEATEALKQKVAQQVLFLVRHSPSLTTEAETELRQTVEAARNTFLGALQHAAEAGTAVSLAPGSPAYLSALAETARQSPKDFPLERFAAIWASGASDAAEAENLLKPLRDVMAQPIVSIKTDATFGAAPLVRVLPVKNINEAPSAEELDSPGQNLSPGKIISLWRARRVVETHFPSGQEQLGKFAARFVRANAIPDPVFTEILRTRKQEGITANDTYDAAQVIVHRGQVIDRRALSALAAMREKSLIGALQTKLEQERSVGGQISRQTTWIAASLTGVGLALVLVFWRLRTRPSTALVPVAAHPHPELIDGDAWQQRALAAEAKAERAHEAIRTGVLGWMREKIFRTLSSHRTELLTAQQKAEAEMQELEQRLEQLHTPLQERIVAYEKRIEELEKDLAAKGEENRELLGARINVAKQQLLVERERRRFGSN
jgi:hypothetical protein